MQHNARNYNSAVISYSQAIEYAEKQEDHYLLGLIHTQIGNIHDLYYNYPSSIEAYNKAYKHYCQTTNKAHQQYALFDLVNAYSSAMQYDRGFEVLSKQLNDPDIVADTSFYASCLSQQALIYYSRGQYSQAKDVILSIPNNHGARLSLSEDLILAHIYALENKPDSTELYLNAARACATSVTEKASIVFTESKINECTKNYVKAFKNLEWCMNIQDSIARLSLNQSVTSAQRDYYENQSKFVAYKLKMNHLYLLLIVIIAVLLVIGLILYFVHMRKMKELEAAEYMAMIYRIQDSLQIVKKEKNQQLCQMSELVQRLFKDQFKLIDRLGNTYYERQNTKSERDAIFNDVKSEINRHCLDKEAKNKLEQIVNNCNNNIIRKLREQIPQITEDDCVLMCYLIAGFSYRAISIFTQNKVDNIYARKNRIKVKIENSDAPDKDVFNKIIC